jgi:hypothetical protein
MQGIRAQAGQFIPLVLKPCFIFFEMDTCCLGFGISTAIFCDLYPKLCRKKDPTQKMYRAFRALLEQRKPSLNFSISLKTKSIQFAARPQEHCKNAKNGMWITPKIGQFLSRKTESLLYPNSAKLSHFYPRTESLLYPLISKNVLISVGCEPSNLVIFSKRERVTI